MPQDQANTAGMVTARDLRGRGWTAAVISRFMPKPDVTETNPHYALSQPMRFYEPARVQALGAMPEVAAALGLAATRSARAVQALAGRKAQAEPSG